MDAQLLLAQIIGGIGIALLIATFQVNDRSAILKLQIASCLAWSTYYLLTGAYTGAGMVFVGALRCYAFERYRQHEWIFEMFILVYTAMTALTWTGSSSILPFFGILLASTAMWQKTPSNIRYLSLTPTIFWLPYNFLSHSYLGMFGDLVTLTSVMIGIFRYDVMPWLRRRQQGFELEEIESV